MQQINCPICGMLRDDETYTNCPRCDWQYIGIESEDDPDIREQPNPVSINEAKRLFLSGKNIWGDPLPKENK